MRKNMISCLLFFVIVFLSNVNAYALDWLRLHEHADEVYSSNNQKQVDENLSAIEKLYVLGLMYLNGHRNDEAQAAFQSIVDLDPSSVEARWGIAEVRRRKNQIRDSEKLLNELIEKRPEFWPAHITLAYIKYTQEDFQKAVGLATNVMRQGRENVDLSNFTRSYLIIGGAKGMIASRGGPISKVINGLQVLPNLKRAEELQPESAAVSFGLGSFYFLAPIIAGGNRDKAKHYLEKAVKEDPLFADAYVRLAQLYNMQGDEDKSNEYLQKALDIDPENALVLDFKTGRCRFACISVRE